jgi:hypothetical protein
MREIIFIVDFATKKKGEKWTCDRMLANHLVTVDMVAKYTDANEADAKQAYGKDLEKKIKK